ncbi:MAG: hypothetical protein V3R32_01420 [Nitrosomonadaceae bacterium]
MSNIRENKIAITRSGKTRSKLATIKLFHLLFFSSLIGLFSLSTNAAEQTNAASKTNSGYYYGIFGKGVFRGTPGLYGSKVSVDGKNEIDGNGPNSSTTKSLDSIREGTDKPKKNFIFSRYNLDQARDSVQIGHDVARAETEFIRHRLRLPRKTQKKISRVVQSKNFIQA